MEPADRAESTCGDANPGREPVVRTALHRLLLLPSMGDMLDRFLGDIDKAERRVMVETYIFADDKMGQLVGDALATAAKRDVAVRLLFDPQFVSRVAKLFAADRELSLRIDERFLSARGLVDQTIDQLAADALNVVDRLAGPSR